VDVRTVYDDRYADLYRALYIEHPMWSDKHACNLRILGELLRPGGSWLDTCCGQAWHFAHAGAGVRCTGIDVSAAQLRRARRDNPAATFVEADVATVELGAARFDLVTNFWGAYSYLDDHDRIAALVGRLRDWTAPGGALYLELITPATLAAFNAIPFAADTGSRTILRSDDGVRWSYQDPGGRHDLTSPEPAWFERWLGPWFDRVEIVGTVSTMQQLVATGRRG
jgi:hypothetical protein